MADHRQWCGEGLGAETRGKWGTSVILPTIFLKVSYLSVLFAPFRKLVGGIFYCVACYYFTLELM